MQTGLALLAMVMWGTSSVFAARAARASSAVAVTLWSQVLGLVVGLPVLIGLGITNFTPTELSRGAVAGLGSGLALLLLYYSAQSLYAGVAAALSAVVACVIPVTYAALKSSMTAAQLCGAVVSLVALAAVGGWHGDRAMAETAVAVEGPLKTRPRYEFAGVTAAVLSGAAMSVYYIALAGTSATAQVHAAFESRFVATLLLCAIGGSFDRPALRMTCSNVRAGLLVGVTGITGALAYAGAVRSSNLGVVVPLVSLSPAVTVAVGWVLLRESMSRRQILGLVLAMIGVVLVTS